MAVRDENLADAIARAVESIDPKLILFAPDNTELARAGEAQGLQVAREIFADRNYLSDGWLVPRTRTDALLDDPKEAAERVLRMLREGKVRSVEGDGCRCARRNDLRSRRHTWCRRICARTAHTTRTRRRENQRAEEFAMSDKVDRHASVETTVRPPEANGPSPTTVSFARLGRSTRR